MNKTKLTAVTLLLALCLVFGLMGCETNKDSTQSTPNSSTQPPVTYEYALNQTEATLTVGESKQLSVTVEPTKEISVEWSSSAPEITSVDQNGLIQALAEGSATITATVDGKTLNCQVSVNAPEVTYEYWLNLTQITIQEEESKALKVNVDPEKHLEVIWASENQEIATVDSDGLVLGVKAGNTVITATVDGEVLQCAVEVTAKPIVYTYALDKTSASMTIGEELTLNVIATPATEGIKASWSSDTNSVATVENGVVKAISAGKAIITAIVEETVLTCEIEVISPVSATITLGQPERANLTNNHETLDTLYWEHYSPDGLRHKMFGKDYVSTNVFDVCKNNFWDFGIPLSYNDSIENLAYSNHTHGIHIDNNSENVVTFTIAIDENVKAIRVYTGAWNATNTVELVWNGIVVATGESFTAGGASTAREVTIMLDKIDASITELTVRVVPSAFTGGNISTPGIVILGTAPANESAVSINYSKTEMPDLINGNPTNEIFLTEIGTQDWYYVNGRNAERKQGGNMIIADGIRFEGDNVFDDYKGNFTWTDGTNVQKSSGVNNDGKFGAWASVLTKINAETKSVHLWVGGYQSTYHVEVYDSKGNLLISELVAEQGNATRSFELKFEVSTETEETLMINIYRPGGNNCSIAAVALHKDVEYTYSLNHSEVEVIAETTWSALEVTANPDRRFEVSYVSSDESIAKVDEQGKITGVSVGNATIKVLIDGKETELLCTVSVTAKPIEYVYTINVESATLIPTQTLQLAVTVNPESDKITITWECSESSIASVDENGLVTAMANGNATINALVNGEIVASCEITVKSWVTIDNSSIEDGAGKEIDLSTPLHESYETLYWEHYQEQGTDKKLNATDLILSNTIENQGFNFYDYKAKMSWANGSNIVSWGYNTNGRCSDKEIVAVIKATTAVKMIKIYTGAWNANVVATVYNRDVAISNAIEYSAGGDGIARFITLNVTVYEETELIIRITPSSSNGGNASMVAIAVLGTKANNQTTTVEMTAKTELPAFENGEPAVRYNLTELGTTDWLYTNFENQGTDEKLNGNAIDTASLRWDGGAKSWDYKAIFTWNDGTHWDTLNKDKDSDTSIGTNNIVYGAWVTINFTVDQNTNNVIFWVGSWQSYYKLMLIDSNGNIIAHDFMYDGTSAFKVDYKVTATTQEQLTFILYRPAGANCSLAAIAIN